MADLQLAETLFTAMDEIIHKRIEDLPYDKTILATIEDNKNAKKGEYIVNDGMTTFKAFSSNTEYSNGDRVYVSIPQGDYDQQKNIIGRYTLEGTNQTPLNYRDPLSYLVDITGNLYLNSNDYFTLIANGELEHTGILWSWSASEEENSFAGFDMITISAGFQSSVGRNQIVIDGNYGLLLTITSKVNDTNLVSYQFNLDSNEFFGDPYNFETYYTQSKVFKLKDYGIERIDAMNLMFYQKGNFINQDYEKISSDIIGYNLAVSNIDIRAGYDIANFQDKDDTIIIYTNESKTYWNVVPNTIKSKYPERNIDLMSTQELANFLDEVNHKTILCRWIHKESENNYICYDGINNTLPETAQIKWYRYKYEELQDREDIPDTDPPGRFWEEEPYRNSFVLGLDPKTTKHTEKIKAVVWNPSQDYVENQINNDNTYVEQERYTQASLNVLTLFNPFYAFKKFFTDEYYKAFFRWQGGKRAKDTFLNSNSVNLTYLNNNEGYKTINNIYEKLLASSNNEDIYRICAIIKGQLEYLRDFLNNSYYSYFIASSNWGGLSTQEKVKKESELLYKFYQKNYVQLDNIDVLLRYPDPTPQDVNYYRNDYDKYYLSMWQVFLNNQQIGDHDERVHILDNSDGFKVYQDTLTEINRLITNCENKNYDAIKNYIQNIENKVNDKETEMLTKFNTMDPDVVTERNVSLDEWKYTYSQILNYKVFDQVYNNNEKERDALSTSLKAEAKYFLSNELEFTNEDPSVWEEFDTIKDLTLEVDKINTNGIYKLYTPEGRLEDDDDALIQRIITAKYTNIYTGNTDIDTAEEIIWKIPRQNTMIQTPQENVEYTKFDQVSIDSVPNEITFPNGTYYVWNTATNNYIIATSFDENVTYYVPNNVEFIDEDITNPYYDENNYVIVRKMPLSRNTQYGVEEANAVSIKFRIKSTLLKEYTNNTITCIVKRNGRPVIAETTLLFGEKDLSGSDYNFYLDLKNNKQFIIYGEDTAVDVDVKLLNEQGEQIEIDSDINFEWYSQFEGEPGLSFNTETNQIILNNELPIDNFAHYILQASINTNVKVGTLTSNMTLKAYLPIIVVTKEVLYDNQGPFRILKYHGRPTIAYNNNGINPSYYQDPLDVFLWDHINKKTVLVENTVWSTIHTEACERDGEFRSQYFPMITEDHKIIAPSIYMNDSANNETITIICKYNNQIIFMMPLFVYLKVYNSTAINQWNGNLTLDHDNGIILSKMMGAGYKGDDNSFYGVLMGNLGEDDDVPGPNNEYSSLYDYFYGTGLYGYHQGQKSFGFNINGYGFIGKVGHGQILFNGNEGIIKSANYGQIAGGMELNFDKGIIDVIGPCANANEKPYHISIDPTNSEYCFKIEGRKTDSNGDPINPQVYIPLMKIGSGEYFLQSANYTSGTNGTGTQFNLRTGQLITNNGIFRGTIYATAGNIGPWSINNASTGGLEYGSKVCLCPNGNKQFTATWLQDGVWKSETKNNGAFFLNGNFVVDTNGYLYANRLYVNNKDGGYISGSTIEGSTIKQVVLVDNFSYDYKPPITPFVDHYQITNGKTTLTISDSDIKFGLSATVTRTSSNGGSSTSGSTSTANTSWTIVNDINSITPEDIFENDPIHNIRTTGYTTSQMYPLIIKGGCIHFKTNWVSFFPQVAFKSKVVALSQIRCCSSITVEDYTDENGEIPISFDDYQPRGKGMILSKDGTIKTSGTIHCNMLRINNPGKADSSTANCRITAGSDTQKNNGWVRYVGSSSIRYKNIIRELTNYDIKNLFNIPVYYFKYKENYLVDDDERYNKAIPGFIAEEIDKIISIAVDHNKKDNSCEMWNSNIIVPLMFQMIKNNHEEIQELQKQIKELKEKIK